MLCAHPTNLPTMSVSFYLRHPALFGFAQPSKLSLRSVLINLFIILPFWLNAQTIHGIVYASGTDSLISNASVYYNSSLTGTITDKSGQFSLPLKNSKIPIIVSCVGYYSQTVNNYAEGEILKIYLTPKVKELVEVIIRKDGMSRKEKIKIFTREFIGTSKFAQSCTISNIEDVDLAFSKKNKTLQAYCKYPIKIINNKLGYQLDYYLDSFVRSSDYIFINGNIAFKDISNAKQQKTITNNREKAFEGSRMQFIRALYTNKLQENGFRILTARLDPVPVDSVLSTNELSEKVINLKHKVLLINHKSDVSLVSYLTQKEPNSFIDENGFHDNSLIWEGPIGVKRIGDMLPYEYQPPVKKHTQAKPAPAGK